MQYLNSISGSRQRQNERRPPQFEARIPIMTATDHLI